MIVAVWSHLIAAVIWIGGMVFLSIVLVPIVKGKEELGDHRRLFQEIALRFRRVVWLSISILLATGLFLLVVEGHMVNGFNGWPMVLKMKLFLVALLIGLTAAHDFWIGPLAGRMKREGLSNFSAGQQVLGILSPWIARFSMIVSLGVVFLGIAVTRV